jgi:hypothetical protein
MTSVKLVVLGWVLGVLTAIGAAVLVDHLTDQYAVEVRRAPDVLAALEAGGIGPTSSAEDVFMIGRKANAYSEFEHSDGRRFMSQRYGWGDFGYAVTLYSVEDEQTYRLHSAQVISAQTIREQDEEWFFFDPELFAEHVALSMGGTGSTN